MNVDIIFPKAALNTVKASRWEAIKARWFGRKVMMTDPLTKAICTMYDYQGKFYMTSWEKDK